MGRWNTCVVFDTQNFSLFAYLWFDILSYHLEISLLFDWHLSVLLGPGFQACFLHKVEEERRRI